MRSEYAGTHLLTSEGWKNEWTLEKEGHTDIQHPNGLGIESETFGLGGRDLTTASTTWASALVWASLESRL